MIRLQEREDRDNWMALLNSAAQLQVKDVYKYDDTTPLGTGSYANVYKARRRLDGGEECALKIFEKNKFWRMVVKGRERADTLVREVSVQATLTAKCESVSTFLKIRGFFETAEVVVIESELLDGTDLFKYITSKGVLSERESAVILRDILQALDAMSSVGLAHRYVKCKVNDLPFDEPSHGFCFQLLQRH
jgi:serine/threonine protein kinase